MQSRGTPLLDNVLKVGHFFLFSSINDIAVAGTDTGVFADADTGNVSGLTADVVPASDAIPVVDTDAIPVVVAVSVVDFAGDGACDSEVV